jgi:hypothetical protein
LVEPIVLQIKTAVCRGKIELGKQLSYIVVYVDKQTKNLYTHTHL